MEDRLSFFNDYDAVCRAMPIPDAICLEYEVVSCLKPGADRQVFLLRNRRSGMRFVLKLAPLSQLDRFRREYEALLRLHDGAFPHPVNCFAHGDQACFLREYVPGRSLAECVEDDEPFSEARATAIALEVCRIVQRLHQGTPPLVHRDIKPQNLILSSDGTVRLVDLDSVEELCTEKSMDTTVIGTAATAAPEQFGYRRCDERTDVYAVGMLMVYLLTGGYEPSALEGAAISKPLKRLVSRSVQFDPRRRFPSVKVLKDRLASPRRHALRFALSAAGVVAALTVAAALVINAEPIVWLFHNASIQAAEPGYEFAFPLIEKAVRFQLGKERGKILESELASITQLNICGQTDYLDWHDLQTFGSDALLGGVPLLTEDRFTNTSDLEHLPGLRKLSLCRLSLKDLSFLKGLPLTHLSLYGNQISDISALAGMKSLQALDISNNPVLDIGPLAQCPALEELDISVTGVTDLSVLGELSLRKLELFGMRQDADLSVLENLKHLNQLCADGLSAEAIQSVCRLENLTSLLIFNSGVKSIQPFMALKQLSLLNLRGNALENLDGIEAFEHLNLLELSWNRLTSLEPLRGRGDIQSLSIGGNPITDFTPLATMPALREVIATEDQRATLEALPKNPNITIKYQ